MPSRETQKQMRSITFINFILILTYYILSCAIRSTCMWTCSRDTLSSVILISLLLACIQGNLPHGGKPFSQLTGWLIYWQWEMHTAGLRNDYKRKSELSKSWSQFRPLAIIGETHWKTYKPQTKNPTKYLHIHTKDIKVMHACKSAHEHTLIL